MCCNRQELKWTEDDLRSQLEDLEEADRREKSSSEESLEKEYDRQNKMISELEAQVSEKRSKWKLYRLLTWLFPDIADLNPSPDRRLLF